ncbi:transcription repressor OFP6-like [Vicia villosa]|uniref:transcription repressor OFP6-like n=1 Tax=Vicia villosa TaxID=3911 RepID=UPI00273BC041|nr:transcription repressor OFP6-like [Vicia villosa]
MSSSKKKVTLNSVSINLGCGTCRRPKLSFIFNPKQKHKKHHIHNNSSSSSSTNSNRWRQRDRHNTETSNSTSNATTPTTKTSFDSNKSPSLKGLGRVGNEGVAVEKDSDDPYLDFRHSMLQMILENEICCKDDLRELLKCFLELNSVEHHGIIIRAFTEIWNGVFSVNSDFSPGFNLNRMSRG